jgi:hypothetical protein
MIELLFIRDLIPEGESLATELRGVTDEGSDNVMSIRIVVDGKNYRGVVVAETNEAREKAMLRWGGCKVIVKLTNNGGTIVMSVESTEDNAATQDEVESEEVEVQEPVKKKSKKAQPEAGIDTI